ncbi:hypothetical protein V2J09_018785 [Rumex salicifolius]
MAFDQNSIPKDSRSINMANPLRTDVTAPPSVPVYLVPATFDVSTAGLGPVNPAWGTRMPAPIGPPSTSQSGFAQNPSLGIRAGSNVTDQVSDDGGEDSVSGKKIKLLCSFGGKILPRPSDGVLRYVGGQTRIIGVRRDVSCAELVQKMTDVCGQPVVVKYQLPDEDLDALVSVSCSDDLENMMEEYEKLFERSSDGSAKLRVFLFYVSELDSSGMVQFGDLQESSQKYVEAVNGVMEVGGCRITRKGSIASATSTQNSDLSGTDAIDASFLGQEPIGTPSTNVFSPSSATHDGSLRSGVADANPANLPENSGFPLFVPSATGNPQFALSQPETLLERTIPHPVAHQPPPLGFDLQQLAANFPPPPHPPSYLQDASNSTEFQKLPTQVIYTNPPQMVATTRPVLLQPQFHDPAMVPQQFIPTSHMAVAPPSSQMSINHSMMPRMMPSQQVVSIPADQAYNAYQAQIPPHGRVAGYGWPQAPSTQEHVAFSEGWMPRQQVILPENVKKIDECAMCQTQLPHAHSDSIVQEQRDSSGATIADVNSMYRSLRVEDVARFKPVNNTVIYPTQADAAGLPRNLEVSSEVDRMASDQPRMLAPQNVTGLNSEIQASYGEAIGVVGQRRPEDNFQPLNPHLRQEVLMNKPVHGDLPFLSNKPLVNEPAIDYKGLPVSKDEPTRFTASHERVNLIDGMQHNAISQPEIHPVDQPVNDELFIHPSQQMMGREQFSNDGMSSPPLISEANPMQSMTSTTDIESVANDKWNGNFIESSNSLYINQDPWNFHQEPHYPPPRPNKLTARKEISAPNANALDTAIYSEPSESDKGSSDDLVKQELQATAEGVASSVLISSLASSADTFSDANQEREILTNSDAVIHAKLEGLNVKPEQANLGFPPSDHLQIIKNSDLEELRELGSGTFGTVYHGKWRGTDVAIKRINDRCFAGKQSEQERMREDFWNEASRLAELHHPNVVAFYGVVLDGPGGSFATVTEYMVNGSLRSALQKNERSLEKRKRLVIAMDVAFGMEYLHSRNIVHFDLKSDNLLVNLRDPHRPICKVGDLGLSKVKCKTLISGGVRGTLPWMAPELLNGSSSLVSEKVDVFSFGIVMWELLTGEEPYSDLHYGAIIGGIVSNTLRPYIPDSCDPDWRLLMEKCWSAEPMERPSFTEIANDLRLMAAKIPPKGQSSTTRTQAQ